MPAPSNTPSDGAITDRDELRVRPVRGPPAGRSGESAEVMLRLAQEHDRMARGMDDIVAHRLFSAGLCLETALELMGGHPAAGKVEDAIGELDLALAGVRTVLFDHHQPDSPPGGRPG